METKINERLQESYKEQARLVDRSRVWNTTDCINQKVKNIMWNTDRKFENYYR